ncbi:FliI/YscN family ATPase [bacterium]|nr:FliI/YscN family ATPase [bacterium]
MTTSGLKEVIAQIIPMEIRGRVENVVGLTVSAREFPVPLGARCRIQRSSGTPLDVEVVGFRDDLTLMVAYGDLRGVRRNDVVELVTATPLVPVGPMLLGRVLNGLGQIDDEGPPVMLPHRVSLYRDPPPPMQRPRIKEPMPTGIRAIDSLLTCAKGQRLGIFAGSGVGKSTTLGMIARYCQADVIVVGLVGERGREVREFLEKDLGEEGRKRSVVVCATSDQPALVRLKAAFTATSVAEYFRDQGKDVLLMMDSLTRLAMAQREIGLSAGEPPTTKGYPPSVFAMMPRLLERAGLGSRGSITALYTVLVEGDDVNEIVSDTVRGILDGHVWLSRRLAALSHFPAIDVLDSISRSMPDVVPDHHLDQSMKLKRILATYSENEDLISVGAYVRGTSPEIDTAIAMREPINEFLRQSMNDHTPFGETCQKLAELVDRSQQMSRSPGVASPIPPRIPRS